MTIGRSHNNKILSTIMYEVEYKDGHKYLLAANMIAENMLAKIYGGVNWHVLFQEIIDHRYVSTKVKEHDAFIMMHTGTKRRKEMTKGVEVLAQWKDVITTWATLQDISSSYPLGSPML